VGCPQDPLHHLITWNLEDTKPEPRLPTPSFRARSGPAAVRRSRFMISGPPTSGPHERGSEFGSTLIFVRASCLRDSDRIATDSSLFHG
jgi:hypothetical protein